MPYTPYSGAEFDLPEKGVARLKEDIAGDWGTFQSRDKIFFEFSNLDFTNIKTGISIYGLSEEKEVHSYYLSFRDMEEGEKKAFVEKTFDFLPDESERLTHLKTLRNVFFRINCVGILLAWIQGISSETIPVFAFIVLLTLLPITLAIAPFEETTKGMLRNVLNAERSQMPNEKL